MQLITLDELDAAARRIEGRVLRTPLLSTADHPLWIKPENLQPTGAFKLRGATNAVLRLDSAVTGVITHSSGNHAQAVAFAARAAGLPATVVMPDNAVRAKVDATRALGATVHLVPVAQRASAAERLAAEQGLAMIPPYDHPDVIAGQGTLALEILADAPDVDSILVPIGGGGLAAGVATAVKSIKPQTAVIGVEPEVAGDAAESLRTGERATWDPIQTARTAADGVRHATLGELTWAHIREYVDSVVTVTEDEITAAMRFLAARYRVVAEPSGALATAGYLACADRLPAGRTVAVLSGGNVDSAPQSG